MTPSATANMRPSPGVAASLARGAVPDSTTAEATDVVERPQRIANPVIEQAKSIVIALSHAPQRVGDNRPAVTLATCSPPQPRLVAARFAASVPGGSLTWPAST